MPAVHGELGRWREQALLIEQGDLKEQALNSLHYKRFHCEGGAVFAGLVVERRAVRSRRDPAHRRRPGRLWRQLVRAIVALQTISDFADNLVDRWRPGDGHLSRSLHRAITDAVAPPGRPAGGRAGNPAGWTGDGSSMAGPDEPMGGGYFPPGYPDDGGYLDGLVAAARRAIGELPAYTAVYPLVRWLAARYADMQVLKHLDPSRREKLLIDWFRRRGSPWAHALDWWEFAAACGSTLGIFVLLAAAARPGTDRADARLLFRAYFPWICGLHIMLDYFIDQEEDRIGGDLNFAACYGEPTSCTRRLAHMVQQSLSSVGGLPRRWEPGFHALVVRGLPGLYLSDGKVGRQNFRGYARSVIKEAGPTAWVVKTIARAVRFTRGEGVLLQPPPASPGPGSGDGEAADSARAGGDDLPAGGGGDR